MSTQENAETPNLRVAEKKKLAFRRTSFGAGKKLFGKKEEKVEDRLNELQEGFRKRNADEKARFAAQTDTEYWFCVSFESREQCMEFLRQTGLLRFGDKYLDGNEIAAEMGVELPKAHIRYLPEKSDRALNEVAQPL